MADENVPLLLLKRHLDGLPVLFDDAVSSGTASIRFGASGTSTAVSTIPTTDEYAALWEFHLMYGPIEAMRICKSFIGIRTRDVEYEPGWISSGAISKAIGPSSEPYSIGQLTTQLHNTEREFSKLKNAHRFRGRKQTIKYGRIQDGFAAMHTLFVGAVDDWQIANSIVNFTLKDAATDRFNKSLRDAIGTVNTTIFPDLPAGRPEVLINVVYGDISTNGGNMIGAGPIPCHLIDEDASGKWRYLASDGEMQSIDKVFIYGVDTDSISPISPTFSVTTAIYGGRTMTVIDFDTDPRDPNRPNETEITILGKGVVDEFSNAFVNPVDQLRHFLTTYAGWALDEFDDTLLDEAVAAAEDNELNGVATPYYGAWMIGGDPNQRIIDVINEFTRSFLLYVWMSPSNKLALYLLTAKNAQNPPAPSLYVDETVILKKSFACFGNRDVYSSITHQRIYNWTLQRFASTTGGTIEVDIRRDFPLAPTSRMLPVPHEDRALPLAYDAGTMTNAVFGDADTPDAPARLVSLKYVADYGTAVSVATVYGLLASEQVQFCQFELPPEYLLNAAADLNRYVAVTHWQGISSEGGFDNALFRIVRTETSIEPKNTRIKLTGIRLIA